MNLCTIQNLTKHLGERFLFEDANLLINAGDRIGLIGVNGSGKSTLLRIVAGIDAPDSGTVTVWGGVRVEYLAQEPTLDDSLTVLETIFAGEHPQMQLLRAYEEAADALLQTPQMPGVQERMVALTSEMDRTGGWSAEADAKSILTQLGIAQFSTRVGTLSGGQRKRVALARALIDPADLLILDEPTNHIDAATVEWLETYLAQMPRALLMVTHDRYFLDRVVNRIVELDRRQLVSYTGNYSRYLEDRDARHEREAEAEQKRQKLLRRELEWLRRSPMARGTKQKARQQRAQELMQIAHDSGQETVAMALASQRLGKQVLHARDIELAFDQDVILQGLDLELEPGARIGIMGPNGAGKSTLLDVLAGRLTPQRGSIEWGDTVTLGYYDQTSIDLDPNQRVIEFIQNEAPLIRTRDGERIEAAQMLEWFLFPRPMQWGRIGSLSGGERRRLYLLRTLIHQPNVLFLDEPTNDLDIQTLAVLEEFLDHFTGCLVVVSHDRYFLDRTVDFLTVLEGGKLGPRYPTPYSVFLRLQQEAAANNATRNRPSNGAHAPATESGTESAASPRTSQPATATAAPARKLTWREQQELGKLETRIQKLEATKEELLTAINGAGSDYLEMEKLARRMESLDTELETALERWMELAEYA
ncbi:MAG: ABC-F family ATP-binding cassette domain-containing protein [Litorilinea sp.]